MLSDKAFRALVVSLASSQETTLSWMMRDVTELPALGALVRVRYSSMNHKDARDLVGSADIAGRYPFTPGLDVAGEIIESVSPALSPGQPVIVTGYDLGISIPGGYSECVTVRPEWLTALPAGLSSHDSMTFGTAGLTAALCVDALQRQQVYPDRGDVLVTGATGGVGSLAVSILAKLGYQVTAATGKPDAHDWLKSLGAAAVVARSELAMPSGQELLDERWSGVVDTIGGAVLSTALRATCYGGCVTVVGSPQSMALNTSILPFIARGLTVQGINSIHASQALRATLWSRLAGPWRPEPAVLATLCRTVLLSNTENLLAAARAFVNGHARGRVVIKIDEN